MGPITNLTPPQSLKPVKASNEKQSIYSIFIVYFDLFWKKHKYIYIYIYIYRYISI